ncbi:organomercurial lyase [Streptomyces sp. NPDC048415]|uniref:organomercurial lyase n=1 Tax=Streptomyces sp. NPDC048415 TaxID=3154822 RepID=UPI00341E3EA1
MRITLLTVPDCPNAPLVRERIGQALDGRTPEVELVEVTDEAQAARLGMTGSPTVLVDGTDPFAVPGAAASVSCRLYRSPDGRVEGAPSLADLQRALYVAKAGEDSDCPPMDAAGRGGRGRLAPVSGGLRAMQQAILRSFATTGQAPEPADLEQVADPSGRDLREILADLAAEDFLTLDDQGRIRAAYPFSATPTAHRLHLADGTEAWAMCAIDALGVPDMLGTDAVITSADPVTGETVTVTSTGGHMTWRPTTAVVYVGQRSCTGPAADIACGALNFFTSGRTARSWAEQHPDFTGKAIDQTRAEALGRSVFGSLLTQAEPARPSGNPAAVKTERQHGRERG